MAKISSSNITKLIDKAKWPADKKGQVSFVENKYSKTEIAAIKKLTDPILKLSKEWTAFDKTGSAFTLKNWPNMVILQGGKDRDIEKFIFTNGSAEHAKNILTHLGVYDLFGREKVFDIKDARYVPKPEAETFDLMVKKFNIDPKETIYIEDIAKNLSIGHARGCTTVWLINDEHFGKMDADKDFISHKIENLSLFLKEIRLLKSQ